MDITELKFTCPRCGQHRMEVVERATLKTPVFFDASGDCDYDDGFTEREDAETLEYRCADCHEHIPATSASDVVEYLKKQNKPKELYKLEPNMVVILDERSQYPGVWLVARVYGEHNERFAGYRIRYDVSGCVALDCSAQELFVSVVRRVFKRELDGACVPIPPSKLRDILENGARRTNVDYLVWKYPEEDDHAED